MVLCGFTRAAFSLALTTQPKECHFTNSSVCLRACKCVSDICLFYVRLPVSLPVCLIFASQVLIIGVMFVIHDFEGKKHDMYFL